jgi:hypothetical protein
VSGRNANGAPAAVADAFCNASSESVSSFSVLSMRRQKIGIPVVK